MSVPATHVRMEEHVLTRLMDIVALAKPVIQETLAKQVKKTFELRLISVAV